MRISSAFAPRAPGRISFSAIVCGTEARDSAIKFAVLIAVPEGASSLPL